MTFYLEFDTEVLVQCKHSTGGQIPVVWSLISKMQCLMLPRGRELRIDVNYAFPYKMKKRTLGLGGVTNNNCFLIAD